MVLASLADELSEVRAEILRLRRREAALCAAVIDLDPRFRDMREGHPVSASSARTTPKPRPGWPIRRNLPAAPDPAPGLRL